MQGKIDGKGKINGLSISNTTRCLSAEFINALFGAVNFITIQLIIRVILEQNVSVSGSQCESHLQLWGPDFLDASSILRAYWEIGPDRTHASYVSLFCPISSLPLS